MAAKLLLALVLGSPFWHLGHPLWEVDDARYAEIPREMHENGDWLTPRLNGMHYVEKPPLIYWLGAASYRVFGVGEAAARLPLALLTLLGLLGVWWLGSWLFTPEIGRWSAIILGTCSEYFLLGHLLTPDMAVSVFLLWATGLILRCLRRPENAAWASPLAWLAMGLAFLSKGLIGLLLPGLWTALLLAFFPETRKGLKGLILGWGPLLFLLPAGLWFWAMEGRHPGFFQHFIVEQHFWRFMTPAYNRPGPWYFFIGVDAAGTLPWTPLLFAASLLPFLRRRVPDDRVSQVALWAALVFCFFSSSSSKLATYILPMLPHQALLGAQLLSRLRFEDPSSEATTAAKGPPSSEGGSSPLPEGTALWLRRTAYSLAGLILCSIFAVPAVIESLRFPITPDPGLYSAAVLLLLCLAAAMACLGKTRSWPAGAVLLRAGALACAVNALFLFGSGFLTPMLSARDLALDLRSRMREGDRVFAYATYLHAIPFYTRRRVDVVVNWVEELHYAKRSPAFLDRFGDDDTLRKLPADGARIFVVSRRRDLDHLLTLPPRKASEIRRFGDWILAEF